MTIAVDFKNVDIVFGAEQAAALAMVDAGATRAEILEKTGNVLGCAGANLTIHEGEISVLMGLSGSGKSTLLRAVNRLNVVSRGQVLVKDGDRTVDVVSCDEATLRRLRQKQVAMVFQQFGLLPWRTVEENVGFGLELAGVPDAERKQRVKKQLELVHLDQWSKKYAHELSGGMQQRVGLARALTNDAPILLMDEAYSALDPLIRVDMQTVLLDIQKEIRKTIVFITHDLDEALRLGDQIAILRDGEVIQQGTSQDIVLRPADEYIATFVREVNRGRVIRVDAVMSPAEGAPSDGPHVKPDATLEAAVRLMVASNRVTMPVVGEEGRLVGHLEMPKMIAAMVSPASGERG